MTSKLMWIAVLVFALPGGEQPGEQPQEPASIDSVLSERLQREGLTPNELTDDMQFLRRVSLDLIGRIPTLQEIEDFQVEPDRTKLVDQLLNSDRFNTFLSEAWTAWLIGYSNAFQTDRETFRIWLEKQIAADASFQQIVEQMISATGSVAINGPTNFLARHYQQPAVAVCRSFLGVRIECAQCHDHPFDRWTQDDYQQMQRFFQPLRRQQRGQVVVLSDMVVANNDRENGPKFLTGAQPRTGRYRQELAIYLTSCKPFARNYANRCWYFLMGKGIIDPPDDHNQENPAADRTLLEHLSDRAIEQGFNIKKMFREICLSDAYQRSSQSLPSTNEQTRKLFATRTIKPLLPEQYIDSLAVALDRPFEQAERNQLIRRLVGAGNLNEDYQRTWEYRESAQQLMQTMTFQLKDRDLGSLETIFLRLLTRKPTQAEIALCQGNPTEDVLFALAFGNEFYFNQ